MPTDIATTAAEDFALVVNAPAGGDPRTAASVRVMGQALADQSLWNWRRLQTLLGSFAPVGGYAPIPISGVDIGTDELTLAGHGLNNNDPVRVVPATDGGVPPVGLAANVVYYAIVVDASTVQLSATSGPGAAVDITGALAGDVYLARIDDPAILLPTVGAVTAGKLSAILARFGLLGSTNTWTAANTFSAASTFSSTVALNGNATLAAKLTRSGTGTRDVYRLFAHAQAGATQSITSTDYDYHYFLEPTADCDSTLSDGTTSGEIIHLVALGAFALFDINFKSNGVTVATFPSGATRCAATMQWLTNQWEAVMWTKDVSNI